jgi:hypothetical protein
VPAKTVAELAAYAKGQSGQDQFRLARHWNSRPCGRRAVQDHGRDRARGAAAPLSGTRPTVRALAYLREAESGERPMRDLAAAARTADRIDYWIRQN